MVLKKPQLLISIELITENFEYALKSADRPKPPAIFHRNRSRPKICNLQKRGVQIFESNYIYMFMNTYVNVHTYDVIHIACV